MRSLFARAVHVSGHEIKTPTRSPFALDLALRSQGWLQASSSCSFSPFSFSSLTSVFGRKQTLFWGILSCSILTRGLVTERAYPRDSKNLQFYLDELPSEPSGDFISNIHKYWFGDYLRLERHHGYIQWLFPLPEAGVNAASQVLYPHEVEGIKSNADAMERLYISYEMMLDFYGLRLIDRVTGEVERTPIYKERYQNLERNSHNYLRITRILKCLGIFGLEHLKKPLLEHWVREIFANKEIASAASSCKHYWTPTLSNLADRTSIERLIVDQSATKK